MPTIPVQFGPKTKPSAAHPADVLALVSRTNYRAVRKVLLALDALHRHTGIPYEKLVNLLDAPESAASFDGCERARTDATLQVAKDMAANQSLRTFRGELYLNRPEFRATE